MHHLYSKELTGLDARITEKVVDRTPNLEKVSGSTETLQDIIDRIKEYEWGINHNHRMHSGLVKGNLRGFVRSLINERKRQSNVAKVNKAVRLVLTDELKVAKARKGGAPPGPCAYERNMELCETNRSQRRELARLKACLSRKERECRRHEDNVCALTQKLVDLQARNGGIVIGTLKQLKKFNIPTGECCICCQYNVLVTCIQCNKPLMCVGCHNTLVETAEGRGGQICVFCRQPAAYEKIV